MIATPRLVAVHLFDCATLEIMCPVMPCTTALCIGSMYVPCIALEKSPAGLHGGKIGMQSRIQIRALDGITTFDLPLRTPFSLCIANTK